MENFEEVERYYQEIIVRLPLLLPEGVDFVDLSFLQQLQMLDFSEEDSDEVFISEQFKMVETSEKITIINEDFIVWIVPSVMGIPRFTHVLIALNRDPLPHLETGFIATGVYNSSRLVVRILEKILKEIKENEELMGHFQKVL